MTKGGIIKADRHTAVTSEVTEAQIAEMNADVDEWISNDYSGACPVRDILDRVGDRWSCLVVLRLGQQPERFRALMRAVEGISQRMLTVTLRGLERDGLVNRQVFDTRPPSVEYSLTPLGQSLLVHISGLTTWALESDAAVKAAQAAFDNLQT